MAGRSPVAVSKAETLELPFTLELLLFLSRFNKPVSVGDISTYFHCSHQTSLEHLKILSKKKFVGMKQVQLTTPKAKRNDPNKWYMVTKEGISEIVRIRTLIENSLRVRRSNFRSTEPTFMWDN